MDDIDSYYTTRPAYPRGPAPGGRGYPAPHMMRMGPPPPMGRPPMGRPPMGPPMGPPMNRPPMGRGMGRPMGPGNMGPGPMGPNARGPGYTTAPPPRGSSQQQRPVPPFAGNNRPQSPGPQRPAAPYAAPERPRSPYAAENRQADNFTPRNMIPAPLRTRRTPPPPLENMYGPPPPRQRTPSNQAGTPPMKYSPSLGGLAPLDNIGAVRMRSPSPKPNSLSPSLDTIGAPRPPRSASAPRTPLQAGMNTFLEPDWDQPARQRAHSTNDFGPATPPILPPAPLKTNDTLPSKAYRMSEQQSNRGYSQQSRPSMVSPRQQHAEDIVLGSDFIEEITVGPYQDLDHPPPPPRKDSYPPVSAKNRILTPPPPPVAALPLHRVEEDNSPLPNDRGLRSMFLGDIQAGPYANEDDAPPLPPLPLRARSRSPPVRTPDMSEPASDAEGEEDSPARRMSAFLAGLRISTHKGHDEEDADHWEDDDVQSASRTNSTLPSTSFCPHMSTGSDTSCDIDFRLDEDPSIAEVEGDIPAATKAPRKPVPSMHEYMSLDQLEDMWGKQDQLGSGGFFGGFDMLPVSVAQDDSHPF